MQNSSLNNRAPFVLWLKDISYTSCIVSRENHFSTMRSAKCCMLVISWNVSFFIFSSIVRRAAKREANYIVVKRIRIEAANRARLGRRTRQREAQRHSKVAGLHGDAIACAQIIDSNHATILATILTT